MHPSLVHWGAEDGCLQIGGQTLRRLAHRIGQTPFFAYDRRLLSERILQLRHALPDQVHIHYAVKALESGALGYVIKSAAVGELVEAIRTVSAGEVYISPKVHSRVFQQLRRPTMR